MKFILSILILFFILTSCSFLKDKIEELTSDANEYNAVSIEDISTEDREFIFKYIEEENQLSSQIDGLHKSYLESVPDPATIKTTSMIFVISPGVNYSFLERNLKNLKRSFYDGGELGKLKAGNKKMKVEFENSFGDLLIAAEDYLKTADEVINFYKNGKYKTNLSDALPLDQKISYEYWLLSGRMNEMKSVINKFKPIAKIKNPGEEKGSERSYLVLENSLIEIMDKAELIFDKVYDLNEEESDNSISIALNEFESTIAANRKIIENENFPETIRTLKYNFEDYFIKTSRSYAESCKEFLETMNSNNQHSREYNLKQDAVLRNYNYLVRSYNTTLNVISQFRKSNL